MAVSSIREDALPGLDTTTPNVARMYDYLLGGKDNFAADRAAAEQLLAVIPDVAAIAADNRAFLGRSVRYLTGKGIRQFLDLGSGLPTRSNVHEVAQDRFFLRGTIAEMMAIVTDLDANLDDGWFIAGCFRDRVDSGRKVAIQILEFFDRNSVTIRRGDRRRLNRRKLDLFGDLAHR